MTRPPLRGERSEWMLASRGIAHGNDHQRPQEGHRRIGVSGNISALPAARVARVDAVDSRVINIAWCGVRAYFRDTSRARGSTGSG